jgi:translation elongation factor P/translation initiation factor 5A
MKFIKVVNTKGKEVLINLSNISYFYSNSETETAICFTNSDDFITVEIPIKVFEQGLNAINDSRNVHVFC